MREDGGRSGGGGGAGASPALLLPAHTPARRRVALMLLGEAAAAGGGRLEELPGAVLLVGAEPGRLARLQELLDRVMGGAAETAWPAPAPADPAALDGWLARLEPLLVVQRSVGWRDGVAAPEFLRLGVAREVLAKLLGPAGARPGLLDHAQRRMEGALRRLLADPLRRRLLLGEARVRRLHLPLAAAPELPPPGLVATVRLAAAALPGALRARRAALAACGALLEAEGLDAEALALVDAAALPVDLLRLVWSPALASAGLAGIDPARLILSGADGREARGWARSRGIALVEADMARAP
jgi:hypothetical protein